jgi:hypothetical protein
MSWIPRIFSLFCYNLIHGAWTDALVVGSPSQDWITVVSYSFLSIIPREFGCTGWKWMKKAALWAIREDRKVKGFPKTHENKLGT